MLQAKHRLHISHWNCTQAAVLWLICVWCGCCEGTTSKKLKSVRFRKLCCLRRLSIYHGWRVFMSGMCQAVAWRVIRLAESNETLGNVVPRSKSKKVRNGHSMQWGGLVSSSCRNGRTSSWSVEYDLTVQRTQCCSGEPMSLGFVLTMMNDGAGEGGDSPDFL